jgi:putative transposase
MLDRVVENAREEEVFSREDTPTEQRVEAAFLYHAGLSYRRVEQVVERSYEAVRQWYHRLAHLFEPEADYHATVAVDETKVSVENDEVYVWAAVDVETFEVVHIEVSPGRSDLDALLFLKTVLKRCRGQPVIVVDRGPWYNWALDNLDLCESRRETWGERSLVEAWFGLFKYRTRLFYSRFPYHSSWKSVDSCAKAFAALHNAITQP